MCKTKLVIPCVGRWFRGNFVGFFYFTCYCGMFFVIL